MLRLLSSLPIGFIAVVVVDDDDASLSDAGCGSWRCQPGGSDGVGVESLSASSSSAMSAQCVPNDAVVNRQRSAWFQANASKTNEIFAHENRTPKNSANETRHEAKSNKILRSRFRYRATLRTDWHSTTSTNRSATSTTLDCCRSESTRSHSTPLCCSLPSDVPPTNDHDHHQRCCRYCQQTQQQRRRFCCCRATTIAMQRSTTTTSMSSTLPSTSALAYRLLARWTNAPRFRSSGSAG